MGMFPPNLRVWGGRVTGWCAEEAIQRLGMLVIRCPVEHGHVPSWTEEKRLTFTSMWHYLFEKLLANPKICPEKQGVTVVLSPLVTRTELDRLAAFLFEELYVY